MLSDLTLAMATYDPGQVFFVVCFVLQAILSMTGRNTHHHIIQIRIRRQQYTYRERERERKFTVLYSDVDGALQGIIYSTVSAVATGARAILCE
eukprot:6187459-Pleurochrysis_carterae.AAC.3